MKLAVVFMNFFLKNSALFKINELFSTKMILHRAQTLNTRVLRVIIFRIIFICYLIVTSIVVTYEKARFSDSMRTYKNYF